jgi:hypothetical protein
MHGLAVWFGLTNGSGHAYLFWSGVGSDITEVAIVGGLISVYRRHSCHVDSCWRIGKHAVADSPFVVCRKHHPEIGGKVTAATVRVQTRARQ